MSGQPADRRVNGERGAPAPRGARDGTAWSALLAVSLMGLLLVPMGCREERKIGHGELREFRKLVRTGADFSGDAYVRAETARVLGHLEEGRLLQSLEGLAKDRSSMVRLAAIRGRLAVEPEEGARQAMSMFNHAEAAEKQALLEVVLDRGSEKAKRQILQRAIRRSQPEGLRLYAFREGLLPRVDAAVEAGRESYIEKLFVPSIARFVEKLDPVLGGPALRLMAELGQKEQRAEPLVEILSDRSAPMERRLRAAHILADAGVDSGNEVFEAILERAEVDPNDTRLALPSKQVDPKLVRAAVLGLTASGREAYVPRAKSYLKGASARGYIEVLEALASNPSEAAVLSLETNMRDARPEVRHRAIDLYAGREEARVDAFVQILAEEQFDRGMRETRVKIAKILGRKFPKGWVPRLEKQLTSSEGILPALKLMIHVTEETGNVQPIRLLRERLVEIAESDEPKQASRAGYLLVALADDPEIRSLLERLGHPMPRYRYLEWIARNEPAEHVDFLLQNFYQDDFTLDIFAIRLMSGVGLVRAERALYGEAEG